MWDGKHYVFVRVCARPQKLLSQQLSQSMLGAAADTGMLETARKIFESYDVKKQGLVAHHILKETLCDTADEAVQLDLSSGDGGGGSRVDGEARALAQRLCLRAGGVVTSVVG